MTVQSKSDTKLRYRLRVNGIVQGVGFRPFVYNLARALDLSGFITNTTSGVLIEVEGSLPALETFLGQIPDKAPPLSEIVDLHHEDIPCDGLQGFAIRASLSGSEKGVED